MFWGLKALVIWDPWRETASRHKTIYSNKEYVSPSFLFYARLLPFELCYNSKCNKQQICPKRIRSKKICSKNLICSKRVFEKKIFTTTLGCSKSLFLHADALLLDYFMMISYHRPVFIEGRCNELDDSSWWIARLSTLWGVVTHPISSRSRLLEAASWIAQCSPSF